MNIAELLYRRFHNSEIDITNLDRVSNRNQISALLYLAMKDKATIFNYYREENDSRYAINVGTRLDNYYIKVTR